ncbi:hypothetical protein IV203_003941 [Nitzschia inconspicua]|uniref:Uncharacterized protein n=1 Tax=Nitzschia inconspicua TaxID=303405 RepID=A0A9K3L4G4_9STRA|nr:hypothetical protein IV203_003941 [Nitzschia inconspicua]
MCDFSIAVFDLVSDLAFDDGEVSILSDPERLQVDKMVELLAPKKDVGRTNCESMNSSSDSGSLKDDRAEICTSNHEASDKKQHLRFSRRLRMGSASKAKKFLEARRQSKQQQQSSEGTKKRSTLEHASSAKTKEKVIPASTEAEESSNNNPFIGHGDLSKPEEIYSLQQEAKCKAGIHQYSNKSKIHEGDHTWMGKMPQLVENRQEGPPVLCRSDERVERDSPPVVSQERSLTTPLVSIDVSGYTKKVSLVTSSRSESPMKAQNIVGERAAFWKRQHPSYASFSDEAEQSNNEADFEYDTKVQHRHKQRYGGSITRSSSTARSSQ